jgi:F-box protein 9
VDTVDPNGAEDGLVTKSHILPLHRKGSSSAAGIVTGTLAKLVANFPEILSFEPEIEQQAVPLRKLPDELLVMILRKLDPTSIERFAIVSRKARLIALESTIWK